MSNSEALRRIIAIKVVFELNYAIDCPLASKRLASNEVLEQ